jgi:hypothetical protein
MSREQLFTRGTGLRGAVPVSGGGTLTALLAACGAVATATRKGLSSGQTLELLIDQGWYAPTSLGGTP